MNNEKLHAHQLFGKHSVVNEIRSKFTICVIQNLFECKNPRFRSLIPYVSGHLEVDEMCRCLFSARRSQRGTATESAPLPITQNLLTQSDPITQGSGMKLGVHPITQGHIIFELWHRVSAFTLLILRTNRGNNDAATQDTTRELWSKFKLRQRLRIWMQPSRWRAKRITNSNPYGAS